MTQQSQQTQSAHVLALVRANAVAAAARTSDESVDSDANPVDKILDALGAPLGGAGSRARLPVAERLRVAGQLRGVRKLMSEQDAL